MRELVSILAILMVISCKKKDEIIAVNPIKADSLAVKVIPSSTDTVFFNYDDKFKLNDFALIYLLDKAYDKDSMATVTFKVDFKNRDIIVFSKTLKIKGISEGSQWYGNLELDSIASPLKTISFGYPACGYSQKHFMFYVNSSKSSLVHQWESTSDGGWGTWLLVTGKPEDFCIRTESYEPLDETTENEMGLNTFSDSVRFIFENDRWKKMYLTPKGKIYRSRKVPFMEFHNMN